MAGRASTVPEDGRGPAHWTPALFLVISAFYPLNLLVNELRTTLVGIAIVLAGLPFYPYFRRRAKSR